MTNNRNRNCNCNCNLPFSWLVVVVAIYIALGIPSQAQAQQSQQSNNNESISNNGSSKNKEYKICSPLGGLDLTRLRSSQTRAIFAGAIDDVEFMREYITESMYNDGLRGGLSDLANLSQTLDWQARGLDANQTTVTAGLGYADDRRDRRVDRYHTLVNEPIVGDWQAGQDFVDTASNILPWLLDRRSREDGWYKDHQNGRSEGETKAKLPFEQLYVAVWCNSWGGAFTYYPPLTSVPGLGHPFTIGDSVGGDFDIRTIPATPTGWPFNHTMPEGASIKDAIFGAPYADVGLPGLSMISALVPVYYTGTWRGYDFNDTFLGTSGVDITIEAIAGTLDDLEDSLVKGSFALLADANTFDVVAISDTVLKKIYPKRTGFEKDRIFKSEVDGSIVQDRRNQTYTADDTIWQSLLQGLESADWSQLHHAVQSTPEGERDYIIMNITLTGAETPTLYYAMFDRWASVSGWVVLVFAPVEGVDGAVNATLSNQEVHLEALQGTHVEGGVTLRNEGTLDISVSPLTSDDGHIALADPEMWSETVKLKPGESVPVKFVVETGRIGLGNTAFPLTFLVKDDGYADCYYERELSVQIYVRVSPVPDLNHLGSLRIAGLMFCGVAIATALGLMAWTAYYRNVRVVKASQPLFLEMVCVGCIIMASTIIPASIDDEIATVKGCSIACMAVPWLFSLGFVTTFAALFSKIWRVNKIFHSGSYKRITVQERDVIIPFAVLFSLNFAILLVWTLHDNLVWVRKPQGDWDSYGTCRADGNAYIGYVASIACINLVALVLACIQAYQAREISDEFSESKYIAMCIVSMLQVCVVGVPLVFLVSDNPKALYFIKTGIIFVLCMSVLLLLFVPKMIYMKNSRKIQEKKKQASLDRIMENGANMDTSTLTGNMDTSNRTTESRISTGLRIINTGQSELTAQLQKSQERVTSLEALLRKHGIDADEDERRVFEESVAEVPPVIKSDEDETRVFETSGTEAAPVMTSEAISDIAPPV